MFFVVFCILVVLFLIISKLILGVLLLPAAFCDIIGKNKIVRASGYVIWIIAAIGLLIGSIVLAYNITPEVLEYLK